MSAATLCTPEAVREVMNTLSPDLQSHNQMLGLMQNQKRKDYAFWHQLNELPSILLPT